MMEVVVDGRSTDTATGEVLLLSFVFPDCGGGADANKKHKANSADLPRPALQCTNTLPPEELPCDCRHPFA